LTHRKLKNIPSAIVSRMIDMTLPVINTYTGNWSCDVWPGSWKLFTIHV